MYQSNHDLPVAGLLGQDILRVKDSTYVHYARKLSCWRLKISSISTPIIAARQHNLLSPSWYHSNRAFIEVFCACSLEAAASVHHFKFSLKCLGQFVPEFFSCLCIRSFSTI